MSTTHPSATVNPTTPDILKYLPGWIGFLALILVGAVMVVIGATVTSPANKLGFIDFGACAVLVGAFSWIVGGTSKIEGREGVVGVKVAITDLPWWGFLVDVLIVGAAIAIFYIAK